MLDNPYAAAARLSVALLFVGVAIMGMAVGTTLATLEVIDDCNTVPADAALDEPDCQESVEQLGTYTNYFVGAGAFSLLSATGIFAYLRYDGGEGNE